jgi:hypothetical protein
MRHNVRFSIKRSTLVFMHGGLALLRSGALPEALVLPAGLSSAEARERAQQQAGALSRVVGFLASQVGLLPGHQIGLPVGGRFIIIVVIIVIIIILLLLLKMVSTAPIT